MLIPVTLFRIVIAENSPQQLIYLKEIDGERHFPIVIGIHEALAIDWRIKGMEHPRPLTYDLLAGVVEALGGRVDRIVINDLRDSTFFARLLIARDGETVEVDSRPSDAIALGVGLGTPIFVEEAVFEQATSDTGVMAKRETIQRRHDELVQLIELIRRRVDKQHDESGSDSEDVRELREHLRELAAELEAIEEILRRMP
jgi:bifunctional DNase/RNase